MKPESYFWNIETLWQRYFSLFHQTHSSFLEGEFFSYPYFSAPIFQPSEEFVFENSTGLQSCFWTRIAGKPVLIVDNHQKVLSFWHECFEKLNTAFSVVHIDAHKDDALFPFACTPHSSVDDIMQKCRVSDYVDAAKKMSIITHWHSLTQSFEFENWQMPKEPFLLNLDIDIFGEEGDCVDMLIKTQRIAECWNAAFAVTIATSPGFIPQDDAFRIISSLLDFCKSQGVIIEKES